MYFVKLGSNGFGFMVLIVSFSFVVAHVNGPLHLQHSIKRFDKGTRKLRRVLFCDNVGWFTTTWGTPPPPPPKQMYLLVNVPDK